MAYSNVVTPSFYIDNYLYRKAIGAVVTPSASGSFEIDGEILAESFYTLTPSTTSSVGSVFINSLNCNPSYYNLGDNLKFYIAILNHDNSLMPNDDQGGYFRIYHYNESGVGVNVSEDFEEVLNGQADGNAFYPKSGSTILTTSIPHDTDEYLFQLRDVSGVPYRQMGAMSLGFKYTMPRSPDIQLSMDIEMDGITTTSTSNGGLISNIQYTGNPLWYNNESITNPFAVYDGTLDVTSDVNGGIRNGRKSWSLAFSYINDVDLFSSNLKSSTYTEHPNDSTYQSSDLEPLDDSGNPTSESYLAFNIDTDNSFYAQVWNKTLGGALPFIFQPDSNNNDEFYICKFDQSSLRTTQVSHKVYNVRLKIVETW